MCSDMCPCDETSFTDGGYDQLTDEVMDKFGRKQYNIALALYENMLFTKPLLNEFVGDRGVSAGYKPLTKDILRLGGGVEDSSDLAWIGRSPPTVNSYKECFDQMVQN